MVASRLIAAVVAAALAAGAGPADPERERFSEDAFLRGLRQLGLTDLLDYYVREYPPTDPVEAALLRRELRLNVYQDATIDAAERTAALDEAIDLLRGLLGRFREHDDRYEWQLLLGHDLILKAEPYYNNILFRNGSAADRAALSKITTEVLAVHDELVAALQQAIDQIDRLPIRQFEAQAKSGYIEHIESLLPRAKYFRMWASYYHCLTLEADDLARRQRLDDIVTDLTRNSMLVDVEHQVSHVQAQALLLAGMAYRMLGSPQRAEEYLTRARATAATLPDFAERHTLKWVVSLSTLEQAKALRDSGQYARAVSTIRQYRGQLPADAPEMFGLLFTLAHLEGSVYRAEAATLAADAGTRRDELLVQARQPLLELARLHPQRQTEIYTTLYAELGEVGDPAALDPFEKNLYLAAMLRQTNELNEAIDQARSASPARGVGELQDRRSATLGRAVAVGRMLLADESPLSLEVRPEVRFNLAVCYQQQGKLLAAIEQLNAVVRDYPGFHKSPAAAEYAVRLAESRYADSRGPSQAAAVRENYLAALAGLLERFPERALAAARLLTYARVLQEDGQYQEAVRQYGRVPAEHPDYPFALFHIAECQLQLLRQWQREGGVAEVLRSQVAATLSSAERFRRQIAGSGNGEPVALTAASLLISAEVCLTRVGSDPAQALDLLRRFDDQSVRDPQTVGRSMRLKLIAYQQLGQLDQAARMIPGYLDSDPQNAGATLQGLLETFKEEIQAAEAGGRLQEARRKSEEALVVAENLNRWAQSESAGLDDLARLAFRLEYGEALLLAGQADQALPLFEDVVREDAAGRPDGQSRNGRAVYGLAEAYYHVQQLDQALPLFHRVFAESPEDSDLWWRAFRRELECRMMLGEAPATLIALINQKQVLFRDLGGYRKELHALRDRLAEMP